MGNYQVLVWFREKHVAHPSVYYYNAPSETEIIEDIKEKYKGYYDIMIKEIRFVSRKNVIVLESEGDK